MKHPSSAEICVRPAVPADVESALALLAATLAGAEPGQPQSITPTDTAQLARELRLAAGRADGLFVAEWDGQLVGATAVTLRPGRVAQLFVPALFGSGAEESPARVVAQNGGAADDAAARLIAAALTSPTVLDARFVQALLRPDRSRQQRWLEAAGFFRGSELLYLFGPARADTPTVSDDRSGPNASTAPLRFEPVDDRRVDDRLRRVLAATYEGSLDCPVLDKLRDIDDELAGYRGDAEFARRCWLLVRHGDDNVGCLLLAAQAHHPYWEIVYLGLVPAVRGRGWGERLVRHAQDLAAAEGARGVVLGVDANNAPALAMYQRAGFARWERRLVYLYAPQ